MPDTQKILAEFNELVDKLWDKYGESYEVYDPKEFTREIESFLSFKIQEAVAEERARVRENLPKIITPTVEPPFNNLPQNQIFASGQMNMLLRVFDLLSSLNKSVTKKD